MSAPSTSPEPGKLVGVFAVPPDHVDELARLYERWNDAHHGRGFLHPYREEACLARHNDLFRRAREVAVHEVVSADPHWVQAIGALCIVLFGPDVWLGRDEGVFPAPDVPRILPALRARERRRGGPDGFVDSMWRPSEVPRQAMLALYRGFVDTLAVAAERGAGVVWAVLTEGADEQLAALLAAHEPSAIARATAKWEAAKRRDPEHALEVGFFAFPAAHTEELAALARAWRASLRIGEVDTAVRENALYRRALEVSTTQRIIAGPDSWAGLAAWRRWFRWRVCSDHEAVVFGPSEAADVVSGLEWARYSARSERRLIANIVTFPKKPFPELERGLRARLVKTVWRASLAVARAASEAGEGFTWALHREGAEDEQAALLATAEPGESADSLRERRFIDEAEHGVRSEPVQAALDEEIRRGHELWGVRE